MHPQIRAVSFLFIDEKKLLNPPPQKKVFAIHVVYRWDWSHKDCLSGISNDDLFSLWSSKIHIMSLLLLLHCFLKLVSSKTADLSPATGLLLLSNSFFPFQFLTKSAQSCGLVKTLSDCATSRFTYSNWLCDSKKVWEWNIINLKNIGWEMSMI